MVYFLPLLEMSGGKTVIIGNNVPTVTPYKSKIKSLINRIRFRKIARRFSRMRSGQE